MDHQKYMTGVGLSLVALLVFATAALVGKIVLNAGLPSRADARIARPPAPVAVPPPALRENKDASRAPDGRAAAVRTLLRVLRSQIDMYRVEHGDLLPDFAACPNWEQLTGRTDEDGKLAGDGQFGPYTGRAPENPLNGYTQVYVSALDVKGGDPVILARAGWVYSTADGSLWATDATGRKVVDEETLETASADTRPLRSVQDVRMDSTITLLQTLRGQMEQYRQDHEGRLPDFVRFPNWEQFLKKTRPDGTIDAQGALGPYLAQIPRNPFNGGHRVELVDADPALGYKTRARHVGFIMNARTGRLWATNQNGFYLRE